MSGCQLTFEWYCTFSTYKENDIHVIQAPIDRAVIRCWGPRFTPAAINVASGYFHRKIKEK